jgi:hypothetical protein
MKNLCMLTLSLCVGLVGACAEDADLPDEAEATAEDGQALAATAFPQASAAPFRCQGDKIALRAINGKFVSALDDVLGGLVVDSAQPSDAETFTVYPLGQNQVALQANHGFFVASIGSSLFAVRRTIGPETTFTLVQNWKTGEWALQTVSGSFFTAERGGGSVLNASRSSIGEWQSFTVLCRTTSFTPSPGAGGVGTIGGVGGVGGVGSVGGVPGLGGAPGLGGVGPGVGPGQSGPQYPAQPGGVIPGQSGWSNSSQSGGAFPGQSGWSSPGQSGGAFPGQSGWSNPAQPGAAFPGQPSGSQGSGSNGWQ